MLHNHLLILVLAPAIAAVGLFSYYRFIAQHDYLVAYEAECDPTAESCFIGCEDDACTEEYYYALIERHAADVYAACGPDITDCAAASACHAGDRACSVTYCDPETDGEEACLRLVEEEPEESPDEGEEVMEETDA